MKTWRERLEGPITEEILGLGANWETCAVGEKHRELPDVVVYNYHRFGGRPDDGDLRHLGWDFYYAILSKDVGSAKTILDAIDDRVLELKRWYGHANDVA